MLDFDTKYLMYIHPSGEHVKLINNESAHNPTFFEVAAFLNNDKTDSIIYKPGKFVCSNSAELVHNNAESAGLSCGWVAIHFEDDAVSHSCNIFNTTDRGLIFVDCTGGRAHEESGLYDTIVNVSKGSTYQVTALNGDKSLYYPPLGVIKSYSIYW